MRILVTGGAGFIGSNFVRLVLSDRPAATVTNLDLLTYAGNLRSIEDLLDHPRHRFVRGDIADAAALRQVLDERFDLAVHFAAESHVDRSILNAGDFVRTNVLGTQNLLDLARERSFGRFLHVSTDEVYGALGPDGLFTEDSPLRPSSPYAASKAASDLLVLAAVHTHGLDAVVTRSSNNYGPFQFPEKLIPLMILRALENRELPVYGDGLQIRDWIHVEDHCRALLAVAERGRAGRVYNVGAAGERTNLDVVHRILGLLGRPRSLVRSVTDRPGHDRRYALDATRLRSELGWAPRHDFESGLAATVAWYVAHRPWCDDVRSGAYREFCDRWYGGRASSPSPEGETSAEGT
jgi:dTDP-glucose 4,6-dehydratase